MNVLFDTNVLLDALLEREHVEEAYFLLDQTLEGPLEGAVTPTILINTFYVGRKEVGRDSTTRFIRELLEDYAAPSCSGKRGVAPAFSASSSSTLRVEEAPKKLEAGLLRDRSNP